MKQERILGTGGFVERVLSESREPAGRDSTSSFRDSGAIDKGVRDVIGRGGAVIRGLHISRFQDIAKNNAKDHGVIQLDQQRSLYTSLNFYVKQRGAYLLASF